MFKKCSLLIILFTLCYTVTTFAATPTVVVADLGYEDLVKPTKETIQEYIPESLLKVFNTYMGTVQLTPNNQGVGGRTYCEYKGKKVYKLVRPTIVEISPEYSWNTMQETTLHEFGHILDMYTNATTNKEISKGIESEIPRYRALVLYSKGTIPDYKTKNELFAQVFSALIGGDAVDSSERILIACPFTAKVVQAAINTVEKEQSTVSINYISTDKE